MGINGRKAKPRGGDKSCRRGKCACPLGAAHQNSCSMLAWMTTEVQRTEIIRFNSPLHALHDMVSSKTTDRQPLPDRSGQAVTQAKRVGAIF